MEKKSKWLQLAGSLGKGVLAAAALVVLGVFGIDLYIRGSVWDMIVTEEEAEALSDMDYILVLGCSVRPDKTPSSMLKDRLETAMEIYQKKDACPLLMSGDNQTEEYDEVHVMQQYALEHGAAAEQIVLDPQGLSTYESLRNAKELFHAEKILIVTQQYHLYRALYIARELGIEAYGIAAAEDCYPGNQERRSRELLARVKDFFQVTLVL